MTRRFRLLTGIAVLSAGGAGILIFCGIFFLLPRFEPDPMKELERQTPARIWTDEHGKVLHVRRTFDAQWRFEVPLSQISPTVVQTILLVEDRNFYRHGGIDFSAAFRAFFQNLRYGRIVSGASTISMQLAGMTETGPRRSLKRKIRQIVKARRLEQLYSKNRLLEEYLNRLPFGGKIYGIEAAALYYFGQHASALNRAEAALLCGLPQRPNAYRPDRHLLQALERRDRVLKQMENLNLISRSEGRRIRLHEPLRFRKYTVPAEFRRLSETPDEMYFDLAAREAGSSRFRIACAYHPEISRLLRLTLTGQCRLLPGVRDAAGVVIENSTGRIVALTGTIRGRTERHGQVNAATAVRSAGSALKPFFYAEAISGGLLTDDTILKDLPIRFGRYAPGNYDASFRGEVRAGEALAASLNTPVIRLAEELGLDRIGEVLRKLRLLPRDRQRYDGLSIVLGTAGHTLLDLTAAYRVFPCGGKWSGATFLTDAGKRPEITVFAPGAGEMVSRMLKRPLPGVSAGVPDYAWKTGTSNGNHDAWCFAFSSDYTVGVWFGNKDGRSAASLVGLTAAAPAAGIIMSDLVRFSSLPPLPDFPDSFRQDTLCSASGLRATPFCRETFPGYSLRAAPLRPCKVCQPGNRSAIRILSPAPETYLSPAENGLELNLQAQSKTPPYWFLNGKYLGQFKQKKHRFAVGSYNLKAVSGNDDEPSAKVRFQVDPNGGL